MIEQPKRRRRRVRRRRKASSSPAFVRAATARGSRRCRARVRLAGRALPRARRAARSRARSRAFERLRFEGDARADRQAPIAELERRLEFLSEVGLGYLSLDRAARTLSGGEMQRLRLAAQLGAGLTGALYVLDEPTIGLHPRDTGRLLEKPAQARRTGLHGARRRARRRHDPRRRSPDRPRSRRRRERRRASSPRDTPAACSRIAESPTGRALSAPPELRRPLPVDQGCAWLGSQRRARAQPEGRRARDSARPHDGRRRRERLRQEHARAAGALARAAQKLGLVGDEPGAHDALERLRSRSRAPSAVDQSPDRPHAALGAGDVPRRLGRDPPALRRDAGGEGGGFDAARFSFNTPSGGRCPACEGQGVITHEMCFLPDVVTPCETCGGRRFEPRTLDVRYLGLSIGDVLGLTAEEASVIFQNHRAIAGPLATLCDLGAGYVTLGQGSHTLSGGEAQRLKLAAELTASVRHEPTLYVLDEPTTGLHLADVAKLMAVLDRLVERGDTLVVIEHHPSVIAGADHVVELGPEGGERGGRIVASGRPRAVARRQTATAEALRRLIGSNAGRVPNVTI